MILPHHYMLPGFHTNAYFSVYCCWEGQGACEIQFVSVLGDRARGGFLTGILRRRGIKLSVIWKTAFRDKMPRSNFNADIILNYHLRNVLLWIPRRRMLILGYSSSHSKSQNKLGLHSGHFPPGKLYRYPLNRKLVGPQSWSREFGKIRISDSCRGLNMDGDVYLVAW
jgi:hypothetical protein